MSTLESLQGSSPPPDATTPLSSKTIPFQPSNPKPSLTKLSKPSKTTLEQEISALQDEIEATNKRFAEERSLLEVQIQSLNEDIELYKDAIRSSEEREMQKN